MGGYSNYIRRSIYNPDGTVNIRCRQCDRIVARRVPVAGFNFSTIEKCKICEGYPPEAVLPQYYQRDPTKAPVPLNEGDPLFLYEEEEKIYQEAKRTGRPWIGLLKPMFKVLGEFFNVNVTDAEQVGEPKPRVLESKKAAKRKANKGLFEPED